MEWIMLLFKRRILFPWLLSAVVMFVISYVWHGITLTDISDLRMELWLYLLLSGLAYLVIGLLLTLGVHFLLAREWIIMKNAFPMKSMLAGAGAGVVVYMVILASGLSFASQGIQHAVVDLLWQVVEQAVGGLMVGLGIVYDLHRNFMEAERAQ